MGLKVGLLGTGYWARETQGAALAAHPEIDFAGVWGRNAERTRALADRYGVAAYADSDALFGDVDAVAVALPPDIQAEAALRAARAGCHLLLEKPVAFSTEASGAVAAEAERRGLASVVFFTMRFSPRIDAFLRESAAVGGWDGARASMLMPALTTDSPFAQSPWRRERGGLWDIGPHALSVLLPVMGPVAEVTAVAGPRRTTHLLLGHRGGAVSSLALTLEAPPEGMHREFVFFGENGAVPLPDAGQEPAEAFGAAIDRLLHGVRTGEAEEPCGVGFGHEVVAVLEAAQAALERRATVAVEAAGSGA
ncbi:Gfo/Idh/MocA family protein [Streptomonospora litoralis]|uniref:4-carboxy-2-hydroxymuconate-6-semialdehyde dehydrogenase n=1 Tax=Streptomonospora litoralis TaxID=2498135 RepID=A0A4P6Q1J9_9ACTN|nr:Gfo/Idh/MocA family oxidoreductase [Streptomonospora litoralis]QBI54458.1 4-carboxy-2-hydroxymuconate-6-semialdehyde dehydrogenase [Streptomonospora litoralis]